MSEHYQLGIKGENIACEYLLAKKYNILERNWRFNKGEIDIIAENDNNLIIIEVKTRSENFFEEPREAVKRKKQKLIIKTADAYVQENKIDAEVRFDIITIIIKDSGHNIEHIEDAFYPLI